MQLFEVKTISEAGALLRQAFQDLTPRTEEREGIDLLGRVSAEEVRATLDVPHFNRSTVDGYAVKARETAGSSDSMPLMLECIGEVQMGENHDLAIGSGQCAYVPTGGMIPAGADAVVMVEYTEKLDATSVAIFKPVAVQENVLGIGDDMRVGQVILEKGRKILPKDLGILAATGHRSLTVYAKPRVALISTGDEVVASVEELTPGKILDINSTTLHGLLIQSGAEVTQVQHFHDDEDRLAEGIRSAMEDADMVIVSGGSSMGPKDNTARIFDSLGSPGLLMHGLAIKPGKPTIVARAGKKALIGLPGQPVSAMVVYRVLVDRLLQDLYKTPGLAVSEKHAVMERNVMGAPGKETYQMVRMLEDGRITPVYGKSGMIRLIASAEGYIVIPADKEGVSAGETVVFHRFI